MNPHNIYMVEIETHFEQFDEEAREALKIIYGASSNSPASLGVALCAHPHKLYAALLKDLSPQSWDLASELGLEHGVDIDIAWATKEAKESLKRFGFISPHSRPGEANLPAIFAAIIARKLNHPPTTLITLLGGEEETRIQSLANWYGVGHKNAMLSLLNLSEFFSTVEGAQAIAARLGNLEFLGAAFMIIELGGICFWREIFSKDLVDKGDDKVVEFVSAEEKVFERQMTDALLHAGLIFRVDNEPMALAVVPEELWNGLWSLGNEWIQEWSRASFYDLKSQPVFSQTSVARLDFQATMKWVALESLINQSEAISDLGEKLPENLQGYFPDYLKLADKIRVFDNPDRRQLNDAFLPTLDLQPDLFSAEMLNEWVCGFIEIGNDVSFSSMMGLDESWRNYAHDFLVELNDFIPPWILKEGIATNETGHGYLRDEEQGDEEIQLEVTIVNRIFQRSKLIFLDLISLLDRDTWYDKSSLSEVFQMCCSASIFSHLSVVLNDPSLRLYIPLFRASYVGGELESGRAFQSYIDSILTDLFHPLGLADLSESSFRLKSRTFAIPSLVFSEEERRQTIDEIFEGEFEFSLSPSKSKPAFFQVSEGLSITKPLSTLVAESQGSTISAFDGRFLTIQEES